MKKSYTTPTMVAVALRTATFLASSPENTYGDDQGTIRYSSTEVEAELAD